jgi:hypothetical protein
MTGNCSCGREWNSLTECHCRICHRHFSTVANFDRHQPARHGCPNPATLRGKTGNPVLRPVDRGGATTWVQWETAERLARAPRRQAAQEG